MVEVIGADDIDDDDFDSNVDICTVLADIDSLESDFEVLLNL